MPSGWRRFPEGPRQGPRPPLGSPRPPPEALPLRRLLRAGPGTPLAARVSRRGPSAPHPPRKGAAASAVRVPAAVGASGPSRSHGEAAAPEGQDVSGAAGLGGGRGARGGGRVPCGDPALPAGTSPAPSTRSSTAARRQVSARLPAALHRACCCASLTNGAGAALLRHPRAALLLLWPCLHACTQISSLLFAGAPQSSFSKCSVPCFARALTRGHVARGGRGNDLLQHSSYRCCRDV